MTEKLNTNTTLPKDWEFKKLGTLVNIISGNSPSLFDLQEEGKYPYLKVEDLNNCLKYQLISRNYSNDEKYLIPKNSVIFPKRGAAILNNKVRINSVPVQMDSNLMAIYPSDNNLSFEYLYYRITYEQLHRIADTSTIPQINNKHIVPYKFPLPPLLEQKKIASVLSIMDSAINQNDQLIAQKDMCKKWLMQNLLTGKKRLKGFSGEWKTYRLRNVLVPVSRPVSKPLEAFLALGIRSHGKGTFLKPDFEPEKIAMDTLYEVKENDLIVNITFAWEGAIAIVKPEDDGALVSHRFPTFNFNPKTGVVDYFRHLILQPRFRYMLDLISPGGAGRNRVLSQKDFLKLEVKIPEVVEQIAIAKVLQAADKEIELLKAKSDKLREQKKGMMQVLLTGKKRLKVE